MIFIIRSARYAELLRKESELDAMTDEDRRGAIFNGIAAVDAQEEISRAIKEISSAISKCEAASPVWVHLRDAMKPLQQVLKALLP